jgi:hypothetical protein
MYIGTYISQKRQNVVSQSLKNYNIGPTVTTMPHGKWILVNEVCLISSCYSSGPKFEHCTAVVMLWWFLIYSLDSEWVNLFLSNV